MARIHKWYYLRNQEGRSIRGASLKLYKANTLEEATIYTTPVSASNDIIDQSTWQTGASGFFNFFIGNAFEDPPLVGYEADQYFDLHWVASAGSPVPSGVLFTLQLLPLVFTVDETDADNEITNKLVSNELAQEWTDHSLYNYTDYPHGIEPVDTSAEAASDTTFNKVVSNNLMYGILTDLDTLLTCGGDAISIETSGSLIYNYTLYPSGMIPSAAGTWVQTIDHDIPRNVRYPLITIYDKDTGDMIRPVNITDVDDDTIRIEIADSAITYNVTVIGQIGTPPQTSI